MFDMNTHEAYLFTGGPPCGLAVRVSGYRSRGPELDSLFYQIFCKLLDLERGPLSLVRIIEELLE
jgi:hypothetical protein